MARRVLRFIAAAVLATLLIAWLASGANIGWTRTSVPVKTRDEVTGIEGITYQQRLVPGLDALAAAVLLSALLVGLSFLVRNKSPQTTT